MAWELLPVDYTDAIWSGLKKYNLIDNSDHTISLQDVTVYTNKEKSFFGAMQANRMNEALNTIMSMVENGTDLYEAFQNYFSEQKTLFEGKETLEYDSFVAHTDNLKKQGDAVIATIRTDYRTEMDEYESAQQQIFDAWFQAMKNQLSQDAAGNLQNQCTELEQLLNVMEKDVDSLTGKTIEIQEQIAPLICNNAGAHNGIYRGESLGSRVTTAQYATIDAGEFEDMYIGDYWTIGGVNYRIAAFDYYLNCGMVGTTKHHVVLVPDTILYSHVMNDTNTTNGGYVGSKMYTEGLEQAKTTIKDAFSDHVLKHSVYLTNAVSDGRPSAGAWCDSEVDLMCEEMVYGGSAWKPTSDGRTVPKNYRVEKSQLPLFALEPSRICKREAYWLRDVITTGSFSLANYYGDAVYMGASIRYGVRPAFCIS